MVRIDNERIMTLEREKSELKKENQLLKSIIDKIHESVFCVDQSGEIILYNCETEKIEGMKKEEVLGKKEETVYPDYSWSRDVTKKVLRTGRAQIEQSYRYKLPDGRAADIIFSTYPFYHKGQLAAIYTIARNINQSSSFITITIEMQKKLMREDNNQQDRARYLLEDIVGVSANIRKMVFLARKAAGHNSPVLIVGETGTGKELFAQGIHNASCFSKGPFIPVNCAAIPVTLLESVLFGTVRGAFTGASDIPGLFEQADEGTIFLDEINSMPLLFQAKFLRVLQDKVIRRIGSKIEIPINCRIISATNNDPFDVVREPEIRSDLFFRLATVVISIPPLRERMEDIKVLTMHFIKKYNAKFGLFINNILEELINLFERYYWPGNIRELENIVESAMNFVERDEKNLELHHLPEYFQDRLLRSKSNFPNLTVRGTLRSMLMEFEKKLIEDTLQKNNENITKTAEELGMLRQNLHYRIRRYGIRQKN